MTGAQNLTLTIGTDWQAGQTYPVVQPTASASASSTATSSDSTGSLPSQSYVQNAASTGGCIPVNPDDEF